MTFRQWFDRYCEIAEDHSRWQLAFANPVLLIAKQQAAMVGQIESEQADGLPKAGARMERLIELDALRMYLAKDASRYPAGIGPVEQAAARVAAGELSLADAEAWLARPEQAENLGGLYSHLLVFHAEHAMHQGNLILARLWLRLLALACQAACPPDSCSEALELAGVGWIQVVGISLGPEPNGERYAAARDFGLDLLRRLQAPGDRERYANVLHALGCLHSDPITSSTGAGISERGARQCQGAVELRHGELGAQRLASHPLPEVPAMLETAAGYFEKALDGREGSARGLTLKALAQTHFFLARAKGQPPDTPRIVAWCREALALLPEDSYQHQATEVLLQQIDLPSVSDDAGHIQSVGAAVDTPDAVLLRAASLRSVDAAAALRLLADAENLFTQQGTEKQRTQRLAVMATLMPTVFGAADLAAFPQEIEAAANAVAGTADQEHWPADRTAATLFALALQSPHSDAEMFGLKLLELATRLSPQLAGYHAPVALLYAELQSGAAVNALNAGRPAEAVRLYAQALGPYLKLDLAAFALDHVKRIADLAGRPDQAMTDEVLLAVAPLAFEIEYRLGESGVQALQRIYERTIGGVQDQVGANLLGMLVQLAKGARFDAELRAGSGYDWRTDEAARVLLERIAELPNQAGDTEAPALLDDLLLVSAISESKPQPGGTPAQQKAYLQYLFNRHVDAQQIRHVVRRSIINPEIIGHLLDARTVLLDYYFASRGTDAWSLLILAYTRDGIAAFSNPLSSAPRLIADVNQAEVLLDPLALRTLELRAALKEDPGVEVMTQGAREHLATDFDLLLGTPMWNWLQEQRRAGRDHLCIRPHRALRYYPMQLLGQGGQDLASQWIVTLLPSLQTLLQDTAAPQPGPGRALAIGYSHPRYAPLPELPSAHEEATQVAALMGSEPLLDEAVTESALIDALIHAPRVHLCLHGLHVPSAPLFHQLVLGHVPSDATSSGPAQTTQEDGRLCAYELQGLDLRGLQVLTLGSCDSALGRFDAGDNLSGLPAALVRDGAQTLVGSLWELADSPALQFFTDFHRKLAAGQPRLDAFRSAQLAVRADYPQARDWGAFCYLGDWDRPTPDLPEGLTTYLELALSR